MQNKKYFLMAVGLILSVAAVVLIWNNFSEQFLSEKNNVGKKTDGCGVESCHGLNITCGSNIPKFCDTMYMAGDNCRQLAQCQIIDGRCVLAESNKFNSCKACVERCEGDFQDEPATLFECESDCAR